MHLKTALLIVLTALPASAALADHHLTDETLLCTVDDAEWGRKAVHSEAGILTVAAIGQKVLSHSDHHLAQVEAAIAGRTWTP